MAERADERTQTRDVDELLADVDDMTDDSGDGGVDSADTRQRTTDETSGRLTKLRERGGDVFSPRVFLVALVLTAIGVTLGGFVPVFGVVLQFVGVFLAGFALGAVSDHRHYPEAGVAGAVVAGVWSVLGSFTLVMVGPGLALVAASAGIGLVCGLIGHYFGRDLRDGLTREV
jgi:MFS family permease